MIKVYLDMNFVKANYMAYFCWVGIVMTDLWQISFSVLKKCIPRKYKVQDSAQLHTRSGSFLLLEMGELLQLMYIYIFIYINCFAGHKCKSSSVCHIYLKYHLADFSLLGKGLLTFALQDFNSFICWQNTDVISNNVRGWAWLSWMVRAFASTLVQEHV